MRSKQYARRCSRSTIQTDSRCNFNDVLQGDESLGLFVVVDGSVSVHRHHSKHHQKEQEQHSSYDLPPVNAEDGPSLELEQGFVQ
jgi:hypothetical protein